MADAGTPLIPASERATSDTSGLASPSVPPHTYPTPADYRSSSISPIDRARVELHNVGGEFNGTTYQTASESSSSAASSSNNSPDELPPAAVSRAHRRRSSTGLRIVARIDSHEESALARAHHPLLSPSQDDAFSAHGPPEQRLHPLLSPIGSPVPRDVIVDMVSHLAPEERAAWIAARWSHAQPYDVFVHAFSFLTPRELATVSSCTRSWSHAAYEPSLWTHMDLSSLYTRVDDAFLAHLLGSNRFVQLKVLNLEGCSAITNKSIKNIIYFCPNLRELHLTDCNHINNPWVFVELVKGLPYLRKLELFGCTKEFGIVQPMMHERPKLDLGLFWLEYCAENGMKLDHTGLADCRYDEGADHDEDGRGAVRPAVAGGNGQRGCWGRVKGRIVYANDFYHRGGNYPYEVLYSCQNHAEQDFADPEYHRCHVCEHLFPARDRDGNENLSMWTPLICRVCFDAENLQNKQSWIRLDTASVKAFGLSEIVSKTIHVASRKNLPVSLRSFGSTPARLDYNIPDPFEEEAAGDGQEEEQKQLVPRHHAAVDLTAVPMSTFVGVNGWRIDETVRTLRASLQQAAQQLNMRALLVYDADENIEVLADKRVILEGREGEEHLQLTVQAWHQALEILYPIVIVLILVLHFSVLFVKSTQSIYDGTTNYSVYIREATSDSLSTALVLIIALIGLILLVGCIYLVYRYREACERFFKKFLVADILLIFMFGVATMLWLLIAQWRAYLDTLTFIGIIWNLSMIGLITLYYPMPERLHHFFLILLNSIMAIMMVAILGRWLVLTFLLIFSLGDLISEARPQMRFLTPFLIPAGVELLYTTPKILYTVGGLRLRAADLMCFGMLTGLALATGNSTADYATVILGGAFVFVCVLSSMALMLFVAPFLGVRFRPLPLAVISAFVCTMMQDAVFLPYLHRQNNITTGPIAFA